MQNATIYQAFGQAVATRRKMLKLTQAALASRVGISRASIANIERGRQTVQLHHVYLLASALQVAKIADLLPAPPRSPAEADFDIDIVLSGESMTSRGKAQITDLIASALAQRGSSKADS
jgi:transcriptional regulator with XRE-family HTH domain